MLTEDQRRKLAQSLYELQHERPIDNTQIASALIAVLETLLANEPAGRLGAPR